MEKFYFLKLLGVNGLLFKDVLSNDEDEMDEKNRLRFNRKLQEIRRQKELALEAEEREEEILRQQEENDYARFVEKERLQDEYEALLLRENRLEELKFQQMQRKIENLHRSDLNF